jgi:hypothetical protein
VSAIASALGTSKERVAAMLQDSGGYADVIRAAAAISSSPERASVLLAVLRQPDLSATDLAALLRVAGAITTNPEKRDVLKAVVARHSLGSAAVRRAFFNAAATFTTTPERRDVLLAVLARTTDPEVLSGVILSARAMPADPERRDVLLKVVEKTPLPEPLVQVVGAARELTSSAARRDVLVKVLSRPGLPGNVLRGVLEAAAEITASGEKRDVLVYAAGHQRIAGAPREAYLTAANSISASAERAEALSALLGERDAAASARPAGERMTASTTHHVETGRQESDWDTDLVLTGDTPPRRVVIRARGAVRGPAADDIRSLRPGGSVMVEETRNGQTRRAELTPGRGGGIARAYRVNGQARPFDAEAERWFSSILREFTRKAR